MEKLISSPLKHPLTHGVRGCFKYISIGESPFKFNKGRISGQVF